MVGECTERMLVGRVRLRQFSGSTRVPRSRRAISTNGRWIRGIRLDFIAPRKPAQDGFSESFDGRLRDECLRTAWFTSLTKAQQIIETWRIDTNEIRPHSGLGNLAPMQYMANLITWSNDIKKRFSEL
jgi:putative transposase